MVCAKPQVGIKKQTMINVLCLGARDMTPIAQNDCTHYCIDERILVDCGTSPVMNLLNYGVDIGKIDTIIFTHLHRDHCVGFPALLWYLGSVLHRDMATFTIYGPKETIADFVKAACLIAFRDEQKIISQPNVVEVKGGESVTLGDITVKFAQAQHAVPALCLRLEKGDASLGVSGDTYSYPELATFFKDCDALVYECSFGRQQPHETDETLDALKRKCGHSSATDAANIATQANVKRVYLAHTCLPMEDRVAQFSECCAIPVSGLKMGVRFEV